MRVTWNTNVTSPQALFSRMAGSFLDASHATNQPLNQVVLGNVHNLFPATPLFVYQPRASIAYQLRPRTAVHAGFGVFSDIIPQQIADSGLMNAPNDPSFTGGIGGQVGGLGIAPGVPGSAVDAAASANKSFQTTFSSGGAPCAGIQPGAPTCPLAVSLNTFPTGTLKTPYYYQYNLGVEQQIGSRGNLRADFVGTRGLHEPYQVQLNGYQNVCDGCFAPFPYAAAARSAIWKCHRVPNRREQHLQRIADRLHAAMGRLDPARQLHLQSLPRRSIEWRLARLLHAGIGIAVTGRVKPAACQLRLRCAA